MRNIETVECMNCRCGSRRGLGNDTHAWQSTASRARRYSSQGIDKGQEKTWSIKWNWLFCSFSVIRGLAPIDCHDWLPIDCHDWLSIDWLTWLPIDWHQLASLLTKHEFHCHWSGSKVTDLVLKSLIWNSWTNAWSLFWEFVFHEKTVKWAICAKIIYIGVHCKPELNAFHKLDSFLCWVHIYVEVKLKLRWLLPFQSVHMCSVEGRTRFCLFCSVWYDIRLSFSSLLFRTSLFSEGRCISRVNIVVPAENIFINMDGLNELW